MRFVIVAVVGRGRAVVVAAEFEIHAAVAVEFFAALFLAIVFVGRRGFGRRGVAVDRRFARRIFVLRAIFGVGFRQFEQRVGLQRLTQLHLQLDAGQLQQPDRLLQLRRQGELLMEAEL